MHMHTYTYFLKHIHTHSHMLTLTYICIITTEYMHLEVEELISHTYFQTLKIPDNFVKLIFYQNDNDKRYTSKYT